MNTHSGLSGPLDSSGSYLGPSEVRGSLADEACGCISQLCLQYATAMGLAGLSTVLMFNRLRGLRFAARKLFALQGCTDIACRHILLM